MSGPFLSVANDDRVAIRHGAIVHLVAAHEIRAARSRGNYTVLSTSRGDYRVRMPLADVVGNLSSFGMMRIHRRGAARLGCIRAVEGRGRHHLVVVLDDGAEMEVGRAFQREIRERCCARPSRLAVAVSATESAR